MTFGVFPGDKRSGDRTLGQANAMALTACTVGAVGYWKTMTTRKYGRRELAFRFVAGVLFSPVVVYRLHWPWWTLPIVMIAFAAIFAVATWWVWTRGRIR